MRFEMLLNENTDYQANICKKNKTERFVSLQIFFSSK